MYRRNCVQNFGTMGRLRIIAPSLGAFVPRCVVPCSWRLMFPVIPSVLPKQHCDMITSAAAKRRPIYFSKAFMFGESVALALCQLWPVGGQSAILKTTSSRTHSVSRKPSEWSILASLFRRGLWRRSWFIRKSAWSSAGRLRRNSPSSASADIRLSASANRCRSWRTRRCRGFGPWRPCADGKYPRT